MVLKFILFFLPPIYWFTAAGICLAGKKELRKMPCFALIDVFRAVKIIQNGLIFSALVLLCLGISAGSESNMGVIFLFWLTIPVFIWSSPIGAVVSLFFLPQIRMISKYRSTFILYYIATTLPIFDILLLTRTIHRRRFIKIYDISNCMHIILLSIIAAAMPFVGSFFCIIHYPGIRFSAAAMMITSLLLITCGVVYTPKSPPNAGLYITTLVALLLLAALYCLSLLYPVHDIKDLIRIRGSIGIKNDSYYADLLYIIMHGVLYCAYFVYCIVFIIKTKIKNNSDVLVP